MTIGVPTASDHAANVALSRSSALIFKFRQFPRLLRVKGSRNGDSDVMKRNETIRLGIIVALAVVGTYGVVATHQRSEIQKTAREHANEVQRLEQDLADAKAKFMKEATPLAATASDTTPPADGKVRESKAIQSITLTPGLLAMKPCRAKLVSRNPCTGVFDIGNGQELHLGGPFTSRPIFAFLRSLEKGDSVELPAAFIEYLDKGEWTADRAKKAKNVVDEKF